MKTVDKQTFHTIKKVFIIVASPFIFLALLFFYVFYIHPLIEEYKYIKGSLVERKVNNDILIALKPSHKRWQYDFFLSPPKIRDDKLKDLIDTTIFLDGKKFTSTEEAMKLYLECYNDFFQAFNGARSIRPFLASFPLTYDSFWLSINLNDENGNQLPPGYLISICGSSKEIGIYHSVSDYDQQGSNHKCLVKIPNDSLIGFQKYKHPSIPREKSRHPVVIPDHPSMLYSSMHDKLSISLFDFAQAFAKKHSLHLSVLGFVNEKYLDYYRLGFALWGHSTIPLPEARKLAALCSKELLSHARIDKKMAKAMAIDAEYSSKDHEPIAQPRHISFRISFWDENIDRVEKPYIAEIRVMGEKFSYYTADDDQYLEKVYEESFDEAQKFFSASAY